jgi:exodeoxyribonuclease III
VRVATWNVNSLKARMEAVEKWLARAAPDILLMQETKLSDTDAPQMAFGMLGYDLVHHGEGRWNGVAIALRHGLHASDVITNFGDGPVRDSSAGSAADVGEEDFNPFDEARMVSAVVEGDGFEPTRMASIYAPNGRVVGSPFYLGKLRWFERLRRWLDETRDPTERLIIGGDFNVTPGPMDVWSEARAHGGTHVSEPERAAVASLREWGLADAYRQVQDAPGRFSWWDYRAGMFHRNEGMRIDLLLVTEPVASRVVWAEIDREARKGPPIPSDHAPVAIDLDAAGKPFDPGWDGALARIAARTRPRR